MKKAEGARRIWDRYKYVVLVILAGAALLLWPGEGDPAEQGDLPLSDQGVSAQPAAARELQKELEELLSAMTGVGQAHVLLTLDSDGERRLAQDTELSYSGETASPQDYERRTETVLVGGGSGERAVVVRTLYPTYRGALVLCQGGGNPEIRLAVTQAVAALTGLSTDRVTVAECQ